ncbi:MarR family transcriptional regulator [Corynebacterium lizhenjunii]|uniref:MarR family transcriptional regulator n=1 Tax=Corynebacterium lizhenjunii TaxID=2709394 RepID=A0A7T0KFD8_9CORY|nr:winged helix DNA-binding protein [Corynebacterium lizhenjunii]QPK78678.1 MarR family transcriptional regulator [Corynebacterium lizhenjunii]
MTRTSQLSDHPQQLRYLILALQRQGNRQLNAAFAHLGLTAAQAEALEIIHTYGPLSTKEVGAYLVCEPGSPSRLLATLASKGLTVRSNSDNDKRTTMHSLSPAGKKAAREILSIQQDFHRQLSLDVHHMESSHPNDFLRQLTELVQERDLRQSLSNRFPELFS